MNETAIKVKGSLNKGVMKVKAKSPEILLVMGAVGVVTTVVLACKATLKLNNKVDEGKKRIDETKATYADVIEDKKNPEHKAYVKQISKDYIHMGTEVLKLYAPAAVLGVASLATVFASNDILRKRNAALLATCTTLESAFSRYRKNVVETYGEEVDRDMRFGCKAKEITVVETTKSGKEKEVTKIVNTVDSGLEGYSDYAKFFDEGCSEWTKDPDYNLTVLKLREKEANLRLKSQGYLFLNDVYDMLGIPRTQAGQVVGWIYNLESPNGDNVVDFGIYETYRERNRAFVNGYENVILLDFNVDGVIVDKI